MYTYFTQLMNYIYEVEVALTVTVYHNQYISLEYPTHPTLGQYNSIRMGWERG